MSVIGILFLLLAVAAASKNVLRRGAMVEEGAGRSSGIAEVLKYLAATLRELGKLPFWITCLLAGLVLIFLGQRLANGQSLFGF